MKKCIFSLALFAFMLCSSCAQNPPSDGALASPTAFSQPSADSTEPEGTPANSPTGNPEVQETDALTTPEVNIMEFDETLTAQDIAALMGRGWNLGNTLDATKKPAGLPTAQETAWGNPVTTEEMIALLAETGFQSIRIPTTWEAFIGPAPDYIIAENWLERVQTVVDWAIKYDLYVILNLHHEEWYTPNYDTRPTAEPMLKKVWTQIAEHFAGYSEKLIFEVMNEPRVRGSKNEWSGGVSDEREVINHYNKAALKAIRDTGYNNAKRFIMIPSYAASADDNALAGFDVPNDERVMVSIHSYSPYNFALNTTGTSEWSVENPSDKQEIDGLFARIDKYLLQKGYTVIMGEYGAVNKENLEARTAWLTYFIQKADEYGVPCFWWDNGATSGNGELFGLMNRRNLAWVYPELVDVLMG